MSVFPNPATTRLYIENTSCHGAVKLVEIYGRAGDKIFETLTDHDMTIVNVGNYPAGLYLVKVKSEGLIWVRKFFKE
ncbi:MAG: T9SS type A sorting domain-containing protein [Bacteroidota bacterium]